ncbi:MAG: L-serine ammonia-lyase, iron-sulfur-dependent subunit beta [Thermoanaerobacteraceae bacterium]|nr:L-serine ammonia-lyase, iron-sulfur-dependent subunit beta [Thermoanaerobacteraceae bacterium]
MKQYSSFDILGPIMIGPSSSHTAGAARIGNIARKIYGGKITSVRFYLHGSFAETYRGHGTDRALLAGILCMDPSDDRLRDSLNIAKEMGIDFEFIPTVIKDAHPNTVMVEMDGENGRISVTGSSIGGGSIVITRIDDFNLEFTGDYPTLITSHVDRPGVIAKVTEIIKGCDINIAFMKVFRHQKGKEAAMIIEMDYTLPDKAIDEIKKIKEISSVMMIEPV